MKVCIWPNFEGEDKGDGGVRRVVEAQRKWLPKYGIEVVADPAEADIIACHIMAPKQLLKEYPDKPLVAHNHGFYWAEYEWDNWAVKANAECMELIRQADAVTAPSNWVAQAIRRNTLRSVTVVPHGVDLSEWSLRGQHLIKEEPYVLWNKTRIDPVCDPIGLVELAKGFPELRFITTFWHSESNPPPNVKVTGSLPYLEAKELVRRAAVYLCTSRETYGIGTLEAMASKVPVLAWAWGGQREIIQHKEQGWLSTPGDLVGLQEGLRYCLEHKQEMGEKGRRLVTENYLWEQTIGGYASLYQSLLRGVGKRLPTVSIVVPAYNLEQYLPEALDSVIAQSFQDWECIIVDDKSPDRCGEIAEEYATKDGRFKVIHNSENLYLAGALNTGIAASKGKYLLPLDADNMLSPRALELLVGALEKDRSIHIAYGGAEFLEEDGKRWHSGWPMEFKAEWQLMQRNMVPSTALYRRKVWESTGGYRRRYRTAEDADFWTRATSYGFRAKMVTEADTLVYRNRENSMSRMEKRPDWSIWYPWTQTTTPAPGAIISEKQVPIASYEPVLISVIIPVGPEHKYLLVDALDSLDAQSFRLWECIVVNDTGEDLPWVPSWARILSTGGGAGVAKARNLGIRAAVGKLFLPLDADDTLEPAALSSMYEIWQRHGGYVYSDWWEKWVGKELKVWKSDDYDANLLLQKGCLHIVTALTPKVAWEELGGYDESLPAWEDWDFQLKLADAGVCGTRIPLPLVTYRKDTGMRREDNYLQFEQSKEGILSRWKDYFDGRKQLMGCSRCPGGGGVKVATAIQQATRAAVLPEQNGYSIIEYVGHKEGSVTYRNTPSGQVYRFSASETGKRKYVKKGDLSFFLTLSDFREVVSAGVS